MVHPVCLYKIMVSLSLRQVVLRVCLGVATCILLLSSTSHRGAYRYQQDYTSPDVVFTLAFEWKEALVRVTQSVAS